jgi:5'-nucleotidase
VKLNRPSTRLAQGGLVAVSLGAVLLAPLAAGGPAGSSAATISGANSLTDTVSVSFASSSKPKTTSDVHVLAWNDFHGNLEPASLNIYGHFAGGAAYLSKLVKDKQAEYGHSEATVLAGDNIGASPLANALFNEEPAVIASNLMNVDFSSVGNHEFDKGAAELKRIQDGGCKPVTGCNGAPYAKGNTGEATSKKYPGADYQYLSANVLDNATGEPLFPAYGIKKLRSSDHTDVNVGFIGEVLHDTPTIVTPSGVAGLTFTDEATAANKAVKDLAAKGVKIPILVIHQGGFQSGTAALNGCAGNLAGSPIAQIADQLDPSIKIIISGHTHAEYRCTITTNGVTRLITSAASFGRILTDLTLKVDDATGELVQADATNQIVDNATNAPGTGVTRVADPSKSDPVVAKVVDQYVTASAPLAGKVIGKAQGDLTRTASGESTLGDVIADAQLASTAPADAGGSLVAFMNPGGIRADLLTSAISSAGEAPGEITYGEAFTVQPFGNTLVTKTLTGAQIRSLLEQQFAGCGGQTTSKTLQVSSSLKYEQSPTALPASPSAADCAAQIGTIWINGTAVDPAAGYRVTMNNFLATGGDGFTVFNGGTDVLGGAQDIDSFAAYLAAAGSTGVAVPPLTRIVPKP